MDDTLTREAYPTSSRNEEIARRRVGGETLAALAKEFGISKGRIRQISLGLQRNSDPFSVPFCPYGMVEAALILMYNIANDDVLAFRARLNNLQRLGFLGVSPGKGVKLNYSTDQLCRLVLAVELTQAGLAPRTILRLIKDSQEQLNKIFTKATERRDIVLVLHPSLLLDDNLTISHAAQDKLKDIKLSDRLLLIPLSAQLRKFQRLILAGAPL